MKSRVCLGADRPDHFPECEREPEKDNLFCNSCRNVMEEDKRGFLLDLYSYP